MTKPLLPCCYWCNLFFIHVIKCCSSRKCPLHDSAVPQLRRLVASFQLWRPRFEPRFEPRSGHVGSVVDKVALGQVFSEYFGFLCQFSFHQLLHTHHLSSRAGNNRPAGGQRTKWTVLPPPQETKGKKLNDSPILWISIHDQAALSSAYVLVYNNDFEWKEQNSYVISIFCVSHYCDAACTDSEDLGTPQQPTPEA
jgi:hypothetical protein